MEFCIRWQRVGQAIELWTAHGLTYENGRGQAMLAM